MQSSSITIINNPISIIIITISNTININAMIIIINSPIIIIIVINAARFGGLEEKKARGRGEGEERKEETDDDDTGSCSSMLEDDLVLGPETAFLAEGSVHDTGGMVEWAGTVG